MATPAARPEPAADPAHPGWEDVRRAIIAQAGLVGAVLDQSCAGWANPAVIRSVRLLAESLDALRAVAERQRWDEAAIELEVERRLAERRGHLAPVRRAGLR